jgi:hypothetical protein
LLPPRIKKLSRLKLQISTSPQVNGLGAAIFLECKPHHTTFEVISRAAHPHVCKCAAASGIGAAAVRAIPPSPGVLEIQILGTW